MIRDVFAAIAMHALINNERWFMNVVNKHLGPDDSGVAEAIVAEAAYMAADAMIKQREAAE